MTRRGFHTITLGCKLNRFDTAAIEAELASRGFGPQPTVEDAAVVIVNTCTVTAKADAEARKLIRGVRRRNRDCRLLVTGCYAELDPEAVGAIPGVDRVFGNRDKPRLPGILDAVGVTAAVEGPPPGVARRDRRPGLPRSTAGAPFVSPLATAREDVGDRGCDAPLGLPGALHFGDRSRAFLRVQEGCDLRCSYCVIPRVRGASRSVPPATVEAALDSLLASGYREVVLTGVNVGDYGKDLEPRADLAALLRRLLERLGGRGRIRLNSLEPLTVTDEIIELMAGDGRLAPHLQVPLQSGCESTLRRMRRNYRLERYRERLERLRDAVPHAGLGADVIVGFPGESEAEFEATHRFIESSPLNYLHVFAWSPRPGTPAAGMQPQVHGAVVRRRSARLRALADRLGWHFRRRFVGRSLEAVVLGYDANRSGVRALTGNFIEVRLGDDRARRLGRGELADVRILAASREHTEAALV